MLGQHLVRLQLSEKLAYYRLIYGPKTSVFMYLNVVNVTQATILYEFFSDLIVTLIGTISQAGSPFREIGPVSANLWAENFCFSVSQCFNLIQATNLNIFYFQT